MWRNALRFSAGALAGVLLWWYAAPVYDGIVAAAAEPVLRLDARFRDLDTAERGRWVAIRSAGGAFRYGTLPVDQMTYNVILVAALLATVRRPRWGRVAIVVAVLFLSHVLTFVVGTESLYATGRDPSSTEASVWMGANLFLRVVGMLGVAFGCWWWAAIAGSARSMQSKGGHALERPGAPGRRGSRGRRAR
ncbi:MAG TPA: hypothetical protein VI670_19715 [Thermoanaerobaculia bacterium]|jgi:hypothetical protein